MHRVSFFKMLLALPATLAATWQTPRTEAPYSREPKEGEILMMWKDNGKLYALGMRQEDFTDPAHAFDHLARTVKYSIFTYNLRSGTLMSQ